MKNARIVMRQRASVVMMALLVAGAMACGSENAATKSAGDVSADSVAKLDTATGADSADSAGIDAAADTLANDVGLDTSAPDAAQDAVDVAIAPDAAADVGPDLPAECTQNTDCDDGNPCTDNSCSLAGSCTATDNAIACDDNNYCTVQDTCGGAVCLGALGTPCSDGNPCTSDYCDPKVGNDAKSACSHDDKAATQCDDGNACTADSCNPATGCVNNKLSGISCNDQNPGTVDDTCAAGSCAGSIPECLDVTQCNDQLTCTTDTCDAVTHTCKHALLATACLIDGSCYADGQTQSGNTCHACNAPVSSSMWSNTSESLSCGSAGTCASGVCKDPWPPTAPLANGKVCTLPACDAASKPAFGTSGNWTVTTKTLSTTCGKLIQLVEPRANVGYTKTGKAHPQNIVGGCDYAAGGTTTQIGTIVSNVEASCSTSVDANFGVTSVETGLITYTATQGIGTITATLYDIPVAAGEPDNSCEIVMDVTVNHVPDCSADIDCNDGIACTTDLCSSGLCQHNLASNTCLIAGQCYADGAYAGVSGNNSCRLCSGKFPSQYGWIILSSGEPCNTALGGPTAYTCQTAGQCLAGP